MRMLAMSRLGTQPSAATIRCFSRRSSIIGSGQRAWISTHAFLAPASFHSAYSQYAHATRHGTRRRTCSENGEPMCCEGIRREGEHNTCAETNRLYQRPRACNFTSSWFPKIIPRDDPQKSTDCPSRYEEISKANADPPVHKHTKLDDRRCNRH